MKHLLLLFALGLGFLLTPSPSYASPLTLQLNGVGGATNGPDYIYPYNFSINGSQTLTPLMCVSYDDEIYFGESWEAVATPITFSSSFLAQEDAYLFNLLGSPTYSVNDIQEAVWYLSAADPAEVPTTPNDALLLTQAAAAVTAADADGSGSFDNGQYSLFVAQNGTQPQGDGIPQNFIGLSPTPEPNSLLLLGTGLCGAALAVYRKRRAALQQP